jgi:hypothetical protein
MIIFHCIKRPSVTKLNSSDRVKKKTFNLKFGPCELRSSNHEDVSINLFVNINVLFFFLSRTIEMQRRNDIIREMTKKFAEESNIDVLEAAHQVPTLNIIK